MLLRRLMRKLTSYSPMAIDTPTAIVLYKSVWMTIQVLDNERPEPISVELVRCLLGLFALAPGTDHEENCALAMLYFSAVLITSLSE
jgi:hypothetical protein